MIDEKKLIKNLKKEWEELADCSENLETLLDYVIRFIKGQPKTGEWIPCSERMPEEHDSIFARFRGTDKWKRGMFEKSSDNVNVTAEFEDGTRMAKTSHTIDGEWDKFASAVKFKVVAWQPLPEPYHE